MKKYKVFEGVGHGGSDNGAVANGLKEDNLNLKQALFLEKELVRHDVEVLLSRRKDEADPLSEEIRECNEFNPDLAIDLHTNSGGGTGFEVFHTKNSNSKGVVLAKNINDEIKAKGYKSRGTKTKLNSSGSDYFGFIRQTTCPAIITEMAFIDNLADIKNFDEDHEIKQYAICIAKGVLKTLGIKYIPEVPEGSDKDFYRVVCQSFKEKRNALKKKSELEKLGFDSFLDFQNGYYRVVVGSFKEKPNAIIREKELEKLGQDCFIAYYKK